MACAVRSCRNEIYRRRDLSFFSIPRYHDVKDEWLEILGIERGEYTNTNNIKVCELHFKPKDFCTGKKQLKTHAVPVLRLGRVGKSEPVDSDDEFMEYHSESEPEVVEIEQPKLETKNSSSTKQEEITKQEPDIEEAEEGRRPSRRAAREAAKKIHNTVRSYGPKAETKPGGGAKAAEPSPKAATVSISPGNYQQRQRRRCNTKVNPKEIDLIMECYEEILAPIQAEALLKSQLEYNMVMKTLRSLKAQNVKIICSKEPFSGEPKPSENNSSNSVPKLGSNTPGTVISSSNAIPQKLASSSIVPMVLSASTLQGSPLSTSVA